MQFSQAGWQAESLNNILREKMYCISLFFCSTEGLVSYSMPQGVQRGAELDLTDRTYDGTEKEDGVLEDGLGQLVDGHKGPDNFRLDLHGYGKGKRFLNTRGATQSKSFYFLKIWEWVRVVGCGWRWCMHGF